MKIRIKLVIGLVAVLLGLLTACGGDMPRNNNAKIDAETCVDEAKHNVCDAKKFEQITIKVPFNTSSVEATNSVGELVGNLTEGDEVRIVCSRWTGGDWREFGVLMDDVTASRPDSSGEVGYPDRFATGTIDGRHLEQVVFVYAKFLGDEEVEAQLRSKLDKRFDEVFADWSTCHDNRVVVDNAGWHSVTDGRPAKQ